MHSTLLAKRTKLHPQPAHYTRTSPDFDWLPVRYHSHTTGHNCVQPSATTYHTELPHGTWGSLTIFRERAAIHCNWQHYMFVKWLFAVFHHTKKINKARNVWKIYTKINVRGTLVQSASVQHSPANYNRPPSKSNPDNLPAHTASRTPQQSLAPHHEASTRGDRCLTLCTDMWGAADLWVGCELVAGVAILPLDFCCACDVFACIHMYACVYVCVCVCTYVCMYASMCVFIQVCTSALYMYTILAWGYANWMNLICATVSKLPTITIPFVCVAIT